MGVMTEGGSKDIYRGNGGHLSATNKAFARRYFHGFMRSFPVVFRPSRSWEVSHVSRRASTTLNDNTMKLIDILYVPVPHPPKDRSRESAH